MLCPYCLKETPKKAASCNHCEREIPAQYVRGYSRWRPPLVLNLAGFSAHGKTTYFLALLHELTNRLPRVWPRFFWQALDSYSLDVARERLSLLETGYLPEATYPSSPPPHMYSLANLPVYGNRQLIVFDPAGEVFHEEDNLGYYLPHIVAAANSVVLLFSIDDSGSLVSDELHRLLTAYTSGTRGLGIDTRKQHLVIVYTKADSLLGGRLSKWPKIQDYLLSDSDDKLRDLSTYLQELANISEILAKFTEDELAGSSFVNLAKSQFRDVRFTIVSALGSQPDDYRLPGPWQPVRIVDPLLWVLENSESRVGALVQAFRNRFAWTRGSRKESVPEPTWLNPRSLQEIAELAMQVEEDKYHLQQFGSNAESLNLLEISRDIRMSIAADSLESKRQGLKNVVTSLNLFQRQLSGNKNEELDRWILVVELWRQIVIEALEALYLDNRIVNPYQPGRPITSQRHELFKGRAGLILAVEQLVTAQNAPTLVLHGPRRVGKTSLLLNLPKRLPLQVIPVFVDLQQPAATIDIASLFYVIARKIVASVRIYRQLAIDEPGHDQFQKAPFSVFDTWLEQSVLPAIGDSKLLLCFDEYEKLSAAIDAKRIDVRFLDELRYTIQHRDSLRLLFAGVETLDDLGKDWSRYFINVYPIKMGYLDPAEAEELVRNPDPTAEFNLDYSNSAVASILKSTGCHPYLVQLLCSVAVDLVNEERVSFVTEELVARAQNRALEVGEPYFRNVWDEFTGEDETSNLYGKRVLRQAAEEPLAIEQVSAEPATVRALERLSRLLVLDKDSGVVCYRVPLIRDWVLNYAPID